MSIEEETTERREFLKASAAIGLGLTRGAWAGCSKNELPKRMLGKSGQKLSIVGLGGIVLDKMEPAVARELVSEMRDRGLNCFDVAPSYGEAKIVMGEAIQGYRDRILLAGKTLERDKDGAEKELHRSLERACSAITSICTDSAQSAPWTTSRRSSGLTARPRPS